MRETCVTSFCSVLVVRRSIHDISDRSANDAQTRDSFPGHVHPPPPPPPTALSTYSYDDDETPARCGFNICVHFTFRFFVRIQLVKAKIQK